MASSDRIGRTYIAGPASGQEKSCKGCLTEQEPEPSSTTLHQKYWTSSSAFRTHGLLIDESSLSESCPNQHRRLLRLEPSN